MQYALEIIFKNKRKFQNLPPKVRSLTRGFKYSDLTWKLLLFSKTGRRVHTARAKSKCKLDEVPLGFKNHEF